MRITFILFFLFAPLFAKEKNMIGLGFLNPAFNQNYPLYRSFDSTKAFDTLVIQQNPDNTFSFTTESLSLKPYHIFKGDSFEEAELHVRMGLIYFVPELTFRVLEQRGDSFLVVINEDSGDSAVLKTDYTSTLPNGFPAFESEGRKSIYRPWEQYLRAAEFIQPLDGAHLLYDKPEGEIVFEHENTPYLSVLAVDGDYINVMVNLGRDWAKNLKDAKGRPFPKESWLRWRKDNNLLIRIVDYTLE